MFRRTFINKNNIIFQEILRTNDLLFTCKALVCAEKITLLNEVLVFYRVGIKTNSQSTNYVAPLDFYKAFIELKVFLQKKNIYDKVELSYINHAMSACLYNLNSNKNNMFAFELLYTFLKKKGFHLLGINDFAQKYPCKMFGYSEYKNIMNMNFEEYRKICNENLLKRRNIFKYIKEKGILYTIYRIKEKFMGRFIR